jgi:hypothetical protein
MSRSWLSAPRSSHSGGIHLVPADLMPIEFISRSAELIFNSASFACDEGKSGRPKDQVGAT